MKSEESAYSHRIGAIAVTVTIAATIVVAAGAASVCIRGLNYGWGLFVGVPYFIGFFSTALFRRWGPQRLAVCFIIAMLSALAFSFGLLLLGHEGIICILMATPLGTPFVLLGAWMAYLLLYRSRLLGPKSAAILVIIGLTCGLLLERGFPLDSPTYTVTDAIVISAPPNLVWDSLVHMDSLGEPKTWLFRLGVACPQRVTIRGTGIGAIRTCTLSTGQLDERVTAWEPGRRLAWTTLSTPPPLKEMNPFRDVDPPHLHGFYRSISGEFQLRPLGPDTTLLVRSSSYQHNLFPAFYWRIWCDFIAHAGHAHVIGLLKNAAESAFRQRRSNIVESLHAPSALETRRGERGP